MEGLLAFLNDSYTLVLPSYIPGVVYLLLLQLIMQIIFIWYLI